MAQARRLTPSQVDALLSVTRHLAAPFPLDRMLREVTAAACRLLVAERGSVWLLDAGRDELVLEISQDMAAVRVPVGQGLVGACARERAIVNVPDCYADPRFDEANDRRSGFRTRSALSLPLLAVDGALVGVLQVLNRAGGPFAEADVALGEAVAAQAAMALARARMIEQARQAERVAHELAFARQVQQAALPRALPDVPGYSMHAVFRPAAETGGDAYDLASVGGRLLVVLADAAGHGIGPALAVMQMQAMLRLGFRLGMPLEQVYREVNDRLSETLPDGHFITAFVGLLDPSSHRLRFVSGGQGPILHHRAAAGRCEAYKATVFPMGAMELPGAPRCAEIELEPGDALVLLSDGVYECRDAAGAMFGRARVESWAAATSGQLPAAALGGLLAEVDRFAAGLAPEDDITAVLLCRGR